MITPLRSCSGGGSQVRRMEVEEIETAAMFIGGPLGTINQCQLHIRYSLNICGGVVSMWCDFTP